jgi:lipopolysaccharide heptosyltransferase I
MNNAMNTFPQRILIIRLSAIGDVVRTLPALRALRSTFPSAYIAWVVEENAYNLLQDHPDLDRVFLFKRKKWTEEIVSVHNSLKPLKEVRAFFKAIREDHFDMVLDFHGILKSGVIGFLSGVPVRVGFGRNYCKEGNHLFNNRHIDVETTSLNRIERNLRFIRFLGIDSDNHDPIVPITDEDRNVIDRFFQEKGLVSHTPLISIHPGTSRKTLYKRWDPLSYARVADKLIEHYKAKIIWTWGPGELESVTSAVAHMKCDSTVACSVSLRQLAELFRRCDLFLGSDSGPMHIASFVKTPVVVIYGPTDHRVNAPYEKNPHRVLRKDVSCNPCRKRDCSSVACMSAISPEEVIEAVTQLLTSPRTGVF